MHQGKEAEVPGPKRQAEKKLTLKSGLKAHLHYLEDNLQISVPLGPSRPHAAQCNRTALYNYEFPWRFSLPGISLEDVENWTGEISFFLSLSFSSVKDAKRGGGQGHHPLHPRSTANSSHRCLAGMEALNEASTFAAVIIV